MTFKGFTVPEVPAGFQSLGSLIAKALSHVTIKCDLGASAASICSSQESGENVPCQDV